MKTSPSKLFAILTLFITLFGCTNSTQGQNAKFKNINQTEFATILAKEKAVIVDVRTPEEIAQGIIKGATVFADIKAATFAEQIAKLDKSKTYIIYCRSGARSSSAADYMVNQGFTKVYNLSGGIMNWTGETVKQ
jgi:rhodanese-related sulfurtransferase